MKKLGTRFEVVVQKQLMSVGVNQSKFAKVQRRSELGAITVPSCKEPNKISLL